MISFKWLHKWLTAYLKMSVCLCKSAHVCVCRCGHNGVKFTEIVFAESWFNKISRNTTCWQHDECSEPPTHEQASTLESNEIAWSIAKKAIQGFGAALVFFHSRWLSDILQLEALYYEIVQHTLAHSHRRQGKEWWAPMTIHPVDYRLLYLASTRQQFE